MEYLEFRETVHGATQKKVHRKDLEGLTPEEALDEASLGIALIEPEPQDLGWWVGYILVQMENKDMSTVQVQRGKNLVGFEHIFLYS